MDAKTERIQYLTRKAQRGVITQSQQEELARLLGKNPRRYRSDDGLGQLIGIALIFIAVALIADILSRRD